jgi:hypothetical protein
VGKLKDDHYYTDTATFDLKCGVCGVGLKGEKGAREHAMSTGRKLYDAQDTQRELMSRCRIWGVLGLGHLLCIPPNVPPIYAASE